MSAIKSVDEHGYARKGKNKIPPGIIFRAAFYMLIEFCVLSFIGAVATDATGHKMAQALINTVLIGLMWWTWRSLTKKYCDGGLDK